MKDKNKILNTSLEQKKSEIQQPSATLSASRDGFNLNLTGSEILVFMLVLFLGVIATMLCMSWHTNSIITNLKK